MLNLNDRILTDLESDLLCELFNIGVGRAAKSLSLMTNQEVKLSVPTIDFMTTAQMAKKFAVAQKICGVGQAISGTFDAQSLLLFPESNSLEVVRAMLGDNLPDEMLGEMQQEAMSEIGNIVLSACIGSISNAMDGKVIVELPNFYFEDSEKLLDMVAESADDVVFFMTIDMTLTKSQVVGYLAFILGPMSMTSLREQLKLILSSL